MNKLIFTNKKSWLIYFVAMLMVFTMVAPFTANAASAVSVQPRASDYLNSYNAYVYLPGGGEVRVYFNVEGTGYMDHYMTAQYVGGQFIIYNYSNISRSFETVPTLDPVYDNAGWCYGFIIGG